MVIKAFQKQIYTYGKSDGNMMCFPECHCPIPNMVFSNVAVEKQGFVLLIGKKLLLIGLKWLIMAISNDKNDRLWFKIVNNGGFRFVRGVPPVHGCFGGNPFIVPSIHHTRFPEATWPTRSIKTTCHSLRFAKHTIPLVILKWLAGKGHFFGKLWENYWWTIW